MKVSSWNVDIIKRPRTEKNKELSYYIAELGKNSLENVKLERFHG